MSEDHSDDEAPVRGVHSALALIDKREAVTIYLKGIAMGAAATVPGVSGGTIALIAGIYDRFIEALTRLDVGLIKLLPGIASTDGRARLIDAIIERDIAFLIALFLGILTAVLTLARVINAALGAYPGPTFAFFGGLIGASAVVLYDRRWLSRPHHVGAAIAGFSIAYVVTGATATDVFPETLFMIFIAAMFAITGMVLPGLSGSFILLIFGQFEYLTGVVTSFGDNVTALASNGEVESLVADLVVLGTFIVGAIIGFLTTAYAVRESLDRYPGATFAFLVSLMVGALRLPILEVADATEPSMGPILTVVAAALAGVLLIAVLERATTSVGYDAYA